MLLRLGRGSGDGFGESGQTDTPVLVQIDTEHWWTARPDLWNWWDPEKPGFDPAKRSVAPHWAATEWLFQGPRETPAWRCALEKTLADGRRRYVCIFNWESIHRSDAVLKGMTGFMVGCVEPCDWCGLLGEWGG
jgi:hypothetical protein